MECIRISSSIENFAAKLLKKFPQLREWDLTTLNDPTIFFGAYHWLDWSRIYFHRGPKIVFWCGSDILNVEQSSFAQQLFEVIDAYHVCENVAEKAALHRMGINAAIHPQLFDSEFKQEVCFIPSETPHVFLTVHDEGFVSLIESISTQLPEITFHFYGINRPPSAKVSDSIWYHGVVSNEQFNRDIRRYQACIRPNAFDGFSESVAKSVLMGQYPITLIPYPYIQTARDRPELVEALRSLKDKKEANNEAAAWWRSTLQKPLWTLS